MTLCRLKLNKNFLDYQDNNILDDLRIDFIINSI